jgi:hypothetical protein
MTPDQGATALMGFHSFPLRCWPEGSSYRGFSKCGAGFHYRRRVAASLLASAAMLFPLFVGAGSAAMLLVQSAEAHRT